MTIRETAIPARPRPRGTSVGPALTGLTVLCAALVLLAIVGPYIAPYPPDQTDILATSQSASPAHWLGTDSLGRDVLSRLLVGARLTFTAAFVITFVSTVLGSFLALYAAWEGGWVDSFLNKVLNVMFAIPGILIALLAVAVFGKGFWPPVIALALVYVPYFARIVRSAAIRERGRAYVEAGELAGLSAWRINLFHIFRNVLPLVLAQATFSFASSLVEFGAISFLGLGVQPPDAEWGLMVAEGRSELLAGNPQVSLSAGIMIVVTVVAFNLLGERISTRMAVTR